MVYEILKKLVENSKNGHDAVYVLAYVFQDSTGSGPSDKFTALSDNGRDTQLQACVIQHMFVDGDTLTLEVEGFVDGVSDDLEFEIELSEIDDLYVLEHDTVDGRPAWVLGKQQMYDSWKKRKGSGLKESIAEESIIADQIIKALKRHKEDPNKPRVYFVEPTTFIVNDPNGKAGTAPGYCYSIVGVQNARVSVVSGRTFVHLGLWGTLAKVFKAAEMDDKLTIAVHKEDDAALQVLIGDPEHVNGWIEDHEHRVKLRADRAKANGAPPVSEALEHGLLTDQIVKLWANHTKGGDPMFLVTWWSNVPGGSMTSHAFEIVGIEVVSVAYERQLKVHMRDLSNSKSTRVYTVSNVEESWELEHQGDHWIVGPGSSMRDYLSTRQPAATPERGDKIQPTPPEPVKEHMLTNESVLVDVVNKLLVKWTEGGPAVYTDMLGREDVQVTDIEVTDLEVRLNIVYDYKEETVNVELASFDESFDLDKTAHGSWMLRFREAKT